MLSFSPRKMIAGANLLALGAVLYPSQASALDCPPEAETCCAEGTEWPCDDNGRSILNAIGPEALDAMVAFAYLIAGVFFILALRGLSSPATSRAGNRNGMIGMAIAVGTTLAILFDQLDTITLAIMGGGIAIGGVVGAIIARRIA
ncbi:MAG: NAD(P)(+) transhydrogenase (Re/Si-specific) subunit beta, partial [Pseudomonadota bacterium]